MNPPSTPLENASPNNQPATPATQMAELAAKVALLAAQASALSAQMAAPTAKAPDSSPPPAAPDTPPAGTDKETAPAQTPPADAPKPAAAKPDAAPKPESAAKPDEAKPTDAKPAPGDEEEEKAEKKKRFVKKLLIGGAVVVVLAVIAIVIWIKLKPTGPGKGFVSGNGRIEATEIDVATKYPGRVREIMVNEGDFVKAGQPLAQMQVDVLDAQRDEALAEARRAVTAVASAEAQTAARASDVDASLAVVGLRASELDAAVRRFTRTEALSKNGALSLQELDDDRASMNGALAALTAAKAQTAAARAAVVAAEAQVVGAKSGVDAVNATIARIDADIKDSLLVSPRDGRVQYRIAQPGEVLAGGGKVLNLVDLGDVYLTFFLPEEAAGKLALGGEIHVILDAAPKYVIPAKVSYVASTAQFTPKTVETASERQKLMFRVKAQIAPEFLLKNLKFVKTGLPGNAWVKLDAQAQWPSNLEITKAP